MSSAFVRENDEEWLGDVTPTLNALIIYLSRENNGVRVYEVSNHIKDGRKVHVMSNGFSYTIDNDGRWSVA